MWPQQPISRSNIRNVHTTARKQRHNSNAKSKSRRRIEEENLQKSDAQGGDGAVDAQDQDDAGDANDCAKDKRGRKIWCSSCRGFIRGSLEQVGAVMDIVLRHSGLCSMNNHGK